MEKRGDTGLFREVFLKRIRYLHSKRVIKEQEVYNLVRDFFKEFLDIDYEFTEAELQEELKKVFIEEHVRKDVDALLKEIFAIQYDENPLAEDKLRSLLASFRRIVFALIVERKKENPIKHLFKKIFKQHHEERPPVFLQDKEEEMPQLAPKLTAAALHDIEGLTKQVEARVSPAQPKQETAKRAASWTEEEKKPGKEEKSEDQNAWVAEAVVEKNVLEENQQEGRFAQPMESLPDKITGEPAEASPAQDVGPRRDEGLREGKIPQRPQEANALQKKLKEEQKRPIRKDAQQQPKKKGRGMQEKPAKKEEKGTQRKLTKKEEKRQKKLAKKEKKDAEQAMKNEEKAKKKEEKSTRKNEKKGGKKEKQGKQQEKKPGKGTKEIPLTKDNPIKIKASDASAWTHDEIQPRKMTEQEIAEREPEKSVEQEIKQEPPRQEIMQEQLQQEISQEIPQPAIKQEHLRPAARQETAHRVKAPKPLLPHYGIPLPAPHPLVVEDNGRRRVFEETDETTRIWERKEGEKHRERPREPLPLVALKSADNTQQSTAANTAPPPQATSAQIDGLIDEIDQGMETLDKAELKRKYAHLHSLYKNLDEEEKQKHYLRVHELYQRIRQVLST
jgi:hypothetical protein